jgi:type IV secretion system protein VirB10
VAVHRLRSLESRIGNIMALGLVCALGFALLAWYYHAALGRPVGREHGAAALTMSRAQTEMSLPPLGPIGPPQRGGDTRSGRSAQPHRAAAGPTGEPAVGPAAAGSPPLMAELTPVPRDLLSRERPAASSARSLSAAERAMQRLLSGPVFSTSSGMLGASRSSVSAGESSPGYARPSSVLAGNAVARGTETRGDALADLLTPSVTPAEVATVLPSSSLVLPKGSFIDCTLETAIDSSLPGMTTCVTATDTFGADGKVVLLERGSQLVGETRGVVEQGSARVFVLWTQARTPTGVVIHLASPGTDELGRSGLPGRVNRHFWQRFGAAMLISIINAGATAAAQQGRDAIIYDPTESQSVASEVLRQTLRIRPQVIKSQGNRIEVLVARDLDFRSVYELRSVARRR